jgi:hypothetical protein
MHGVPVPAMRSCVPCCDAVLQLRTRGVGSCWCGDSGVPDRVEVCSSQVRGLLLLVVARAHRETLCVLRMCRGVAGTAL